MTIDRLYGARCTANHNIDQHLPTLRALAEQCDHITEFGTDIGFSTTAFLAGRPRVLHSYDINRTDWVDTLEDLARDTGVEYRFHCTDTRTCPTIEDTDLLFVDSEHTFEQVQTELERHGHRVRKFLAFHDTVSYPEIVPAVEAYTACGWRCILQDSRQNGLWVFQREEDWAL